MNDNRNHNHVFLALIPPALALPLAYRLSFISSFFMKLNPTLADDLRDTGYTYTPEEYLGIGLVSYNFLGFLVSFALFVVFNTALEDAVRAATLAILIWFSLVFLLTYVAAISPRSMLRVESLNADQNLIYSMKDLILHTDSGATLFQAMVAVADSDYGVVSRDFGWAVRRINVGVPMLKVLEELVQKSRSDFFKKAGWQLVNVVKTGSNIRSTLSSIIEELNDNQKMQIQGYSRELNLWSLMYMMFSVAIPTIGSTMLVVLSAFADFGISQGFFIGFVTICLILQVILINFVKSRRPNVLF